MSGGNAEPGARKPEREIAKMVSVVTARHDQDEAKGRDWFASLSFDDKVALWLYLNRDFDNPLLEAMSRLAILQFKRYAMEEENRKANT